MEKAHLLRSEDGEKIVFPCYALIYIVYMHVMSVGVNLNVGSVSVHEFRVCKRPSLISA